MAIHSPRIDFPTIGIAIVGIVVVVIITLLKTAINVSLAGNGYGMDIAFRP